MVLAPSLISLCCAQQGEKPYKCTWPGCLYAATQSGHLTAHLRKHEAGKTRKTLSATSSPSTADADAGHMSLSDDEEPFDGPVAAAEAVPLACAVPPPPGKPPPELVGHDIV